MIFVYRSGYDGPLSKRVRVRSDASVLAWFQRGWYQRYHDQWLAAEVGDDVYGLHSIFDAAREHDLAVPRTVEDLRRLLDEHLDVTGELRMDARTLRVRTDDDEVSLAYFMFDDAAVTGAPERTAYLVHPEWPLPSAADGVAGGFTPPVPIAAGAPDAGGAGTTYVVLLTYHGRDTIAGPPPVAFPGVRLPAFLARLRAAEPEVGWPPELMVLRALAGDDAVAGALERANRWPLFTFNGRPWPDADPVDVEKIMSGEVPKSRDPERSLITVDTHIAQLAMHVDEYFGYQQWFVFDDVWAADHPDLATSLLRYAIDWDPFGG